jgi:pyridoxamine 5'-phosphate oxidase family protein
VKFRDSYRPLVREGVVLNVYTQAELAYLQGARRLAHVATVGKDGTPHVTPVGMWSVDPDSGVVEVTGQQFADTKKFRDVARSGRAAIVVDDVLPPWQPRGIEIRGRADAIDGPRPCIRIHPNRIIGWGLDDTGRGRNARDVPAGPDADPAEPDDHR